MVEDDQLAPPGACSQRIKEAACIESKGVFVIGVGGWRHPSKVVVFETSLPPAFGFKSRISAPRVMKYD